LEDLYRRDGPRMWRSLLLYAGDPDVASDAVAEAFAQALRRGAAVRAPERWVWRAAFRIAAGELKTRKSHSAPLPDVIVPGPAEQAEVNAALRTLSPKQRASIVLHYFAGYTYKEIAPIIGSTPSAVSVHVTRGRRRLLVALETHDE
jgi:RNA polymerase sigma factor (sigma-70 family)